MLHGGGGLVVYFCTIRCDMGVGVGAMLLPQMALLPWMVRQTADPVT